MEKQPIDDLFARKLRDADIVPGADVFGRLQSRLNATQLAAEPTKRRVAGWWYSVAAASAIALLSWLFWPTVTKQTPVGEGQLAKQEANTDTPSAQSNEKEPVVARSEEAPETGNVTGRRPVGSASARRTNEDGQSAQQAQLAATSNVPAQFEQAPSPTIPQPEEVIIAYANVPVSTKQPTLQPTASAERTVVMVIDVPDEKPMVALQPTIAPQTAAAQPNLSQLFTKVKQLKSGDVLARATPSRATPEPRSGIGKLFNGVKESLRNDNTLEP
jgi:hypothetical protein